MAKRDEARQDPNTDRYPQLTKVLAAIPQAEDFPDGPCERVEVHCFASGEATWRVWTPRAEEPVGGYLAKLD